MSLALFKWGNRGTGGACPQHCKAFPSVLSPIELELSVNKCSWRQRENAKFPVMRTALLVKSDIHLKQRDEADTRCTGKDWPEGGCREMEFVCKCEFTLPWH